MENLYIAFAKVIFVLLAMLGVLAVIHRYADRLKFNLRSRPGDAAIRRGETIHLGYRKFLSVVDVKDRTFLLAIGQDQVSLLYHWEKEKKEEALP